MRQVCLRCAATLTDGIGHVFGCDYKGPMGEMKDDQFELGNEATEVRCFDSVLTVKPSDAPSALGVQEGGSHYKDLKIQPVEYIHANGIGYFEGNVIKYVSRWRAKGGLKDLDKARHYIELLIELENGK